MNNSSLHHYRDASDSVWRFSMNNNYCKYEWEGIVFAMCLWVGVPCGCGW